jgi:hypothetical protein
MNDEVILTLAASLECLKDAEVLINQRRYKAAVSRSYYAMFHAAKAALLTKNISTYTHQGINVQFGKQFIVPGIFDKSVFRTFSKMLDIRQKSDYEIGFNASEEDAAHAIQEATAFYNLMQAYLADLVNQGQTDTK